MSPSQAVIAIVGRPNVGKSTFFNRLVGRRQALVEDNPGVTRDRHYALARYGEYEFLLIDTGGLEPESQDPLMDQVRRQSELAVQEADAVLFVVDGREGCTPVDQEIYRLLAQSPKPLFLVANKVEHEGVMANAYDFYQAGVEHVYGISAQHNRGIEDLLAAVNQKLPIQTPEVQEPLEAKPNRPIHVALIGKPNVGKSSLVNALLDKERMIVSEIAGTTRDAVDSRCQFQGQEFVLIDTAGIRRKSKVSEKIETFSIIQSLKAIERADVALVIFDLSEGLTTQVARIAGYANERKKALVLIANKCDLLESKQEEVRRDVKDELSFIDYAPLLFVSAKTGQRVNKIFETVQEVYQQYHRRIQTADLNKIVEIIVSKHTPPGKAGRATRIYYGNQVTVAPPTFVFMTNNPEAITAAYEQYMKHQLRYHFDFKGTPLEVIWRKRTSRPK